MKLYLHPLSSYCQKALIAFYEARIPFEAELVADAAAWARLRALSPLGKIPVLADEERGRRVAESTTIIEYLAVHYPDARRLLPHEPEAALETRRLDRFFDLYVHAPMQAIVKQRLRSAREADPLAVEEARSALESAYAIVDRELKGKEWATGSSFSMADCAAAPALHFAHLVTPIGPQHEGAAAYLKRLSARASVARAFREADPYRALFPAEGGTGP